MSWKQNVEPYATIWKQVYEHAKGHGLVHGQKALDLMHEIQNSNYGPADASNLLADMVESKKLKPIKLDLSGVSFSVLAFRGIGPSAGGTPSSTWIRAEAHLWTYEAL